MQGSSWASFATLVLILLLANASSAGAECPTFGQGIISGEVSYSAINEASGIAASQKNPGVLWVHNDSGNASILFALDSEGFLVRTYSPTGVGNVDWEALGIGPGPTAGESYLYLGDIGDNSSSRPSVTVYRIPEPAVTAGASLTPLAGGVALEMQYPDGPRDAEALFVDPENGDIYIVSKSFATGVSGVYRAAAPHDPSSTITLQKLWNITFPGDAIERAVTGGDISPDGREIILRSYTRAYHWTRPEGGTVVSAFGEERCEVPIAPEPQGEAITFTRDGVNYITVSEMTNQPIFLYLRSPQVPSLSSLGMFSLSGALIAAFVQLRQSRDRDPGRSPRKG